MLTPWTQLPPAVLGRLGEDLTVSAQRLMRERGLSEPARFELQRLENLGLELQTLVHALGASARPDDEALPLLDAAQATRRQWLPELARRGLRLTVAGEPVAVHGQAAQLQHALDLLVAHGLAAGVALALRVSTSPEGQPALTLSGSGAPPDSAEVHGQLLQWLARALQWPLDRPRLREGEWTLRLSFSAPPAEAPAEDVDTVPRRHWTTQDRVLVIDPDDRTRSVAAALLRGASLRGDCVATLAQAEGALRDGVPSTVVCGYPLEQAGVQALRDLMEQQRPGLRWVELVDTPFVFAAGSADGRLPARISRNDLANTLLPSLAD